jgi:hypothetical protein
MLDQAILRQQIEQLLVGRNAHLTFDDAVADFPLARINERPPNIGYSAWHLVEHLRIAQWDILTFTKDPSHQSPVWPEGYWPDPDREASPEEWAESVASFQADLKEVVNMALDPAVDLTAELPHAPGYTVLRELLLVADHNAYHVGELAILRQVMSAWPTDRQ